MDINEVVDMAKSGLDTVCKKTEDAVAVSKLRIEQATLETKLSKDYEKLGRIYYGSVAEGKDADENELELLTAAIGDKKEQIKLLREKIQKYKYRKLCPACKSPVDKNSVYCNHCGEKLV